MKTSEKTVNLTQAMLEFHQKVQKIKKDAKNPHFKSNYATLSNILDSVMPVLTEVGIVVTQAPMGQVLTTRLTHSESGEYIECEHDLVMKDPNNPQSIGSAMSYARRYSLTSLLVLNIDDDDANQSAGRNQPQPAKTAEKKELTTTSKLWPASEKRIVELLGTKGETKASIIKKMSQHYILGPDVLSFINDQK